MLPSPQKCDASPSNQVVRITADETTILMDAGAMQPRAPLITLRGYGTTNRSQKAS